MTCSIAPVAQTSAASVVEEKKLPVEIQEVLPQFFPFGLESVHLNSLKGTSVYKVTNTDKTYVLRQSFPTWTIERCEREIDIAIWAARCHVGPQVLQISNDSCVMLLEYLNGGVLHPDHPVDIKEIAHSLHNLHSIGLPPCMKSEKQSTSFRRFHGQYKTLKECYKKLPCYLTDLYYIASEIEKQLDKKFPEKVLCHLDLHCHNIMRHDGRMRLVDYGMAGPDHPLFDLANVSMYMGFNQDQEYALLTHYYGEITENIIKTYAFFRPLVYLNKITWPLIKASKEGATQLLLDEVWNENDVVPIDCEFRCIYTQEPRDAIRFVRYARSAFEQFHQKYQLLK